MVRTKAFITALGLLVAPNLALSDPDSANNKNNSESPSIDVPDVFIESWPGIKLEELTPEMLDELPGGSGNTYDKEKSQMPRCPWPPCPDDNRT